MRKFILLLLLFVVGCGPSRAEKLQIYNLERQELQRLIDNRDQMYRILGLMTGKYREKAEIEYKDTLNLAHQLVAEQEQKVAAAKAALD